MGRLSMRPNPRLLSLEGIHLRAGLLDEFHIKPEICIDGNFFVPSGAEPRCPASVGGIERNAMKTYRIWRGLFGCGVKWLGNRLNQLLAGQRRLDSRPVSSAKIIVFPS